MVPFRYLCAIFCALISAQAADWPQWRGLNRDGHSPEHFPALTKLPEQSAAVWKISIGGGFSSPVVASDKLVYLDEKGGKEVAHCLDAKNGKEIWEKAYSSSFQDEWGIGPRATPFIDADRVYVQSCDGVFKCLSMADGKEIWGVQFEKDFGAPFLGMKLNEGAAIRRGNNGSGIVDGNAVLVPVGGTNGATLVCLDKMTGKQIWKCGHDESAYSSLVVAKLGGVKQVIFLTATSLMGADRNSGEILWRVPLKTNAKRHAMTPVIWNDHVIVNSHTFGMIAFKIEKEGDKISAKEAWRNPNLKINLSTPVIVAETLYCQGPTKNYIAADVKTGRQLWAVDGFGKENTSTIVFDNKLLAITDAGQGYLMEADPSRFHQLDSAQLCGKNWNYPALSNERLFIRDYRELSCFNLRPK